MSRSAPPATPRRAATVTLDARVRHAIVAQAKEAAPEECCGFLLGDGPRIRYAIPVANAARPRDRRYAVAPQAHIALRRTLRRVRPPLQIVGVYHSHPTGAPVPSTTDVAEAHYPDWVHVIVGLWPVVRVGAFTIRHGRAAALTIRTIGT